MIGAAKLDISQQSHLVELPDAVHARFVWRFSSLLTRLIPSEMVKSFEATANLLEQALRGLGDHEIALIGHHGLTPDDREWAPHSRDQARVAPTRSRRAGAAGL
jgi:hypothetical protein